MKPQQNWKHIHGYEDLYEVSDLGEIFSHNEGKIVGQGRFNGSNV